MFENIFAVNAVFDLNVVDVLMEWLTHEDETV